MTYGRTDVRTQTIWNLRQENGNVKVKGKKSHSSNAFKMIIIVIIIMVKR